jgi:hypothetical protein
VVNLPKVRVQAKREKLRKIAEEILRKVDNPEESILVTIEAEVKGSATPVGSQTGSTTGVIASWIDIVLSNEGVEDNPDDTVYVEIDTRIG